MTSAMTQPKSPSIYSQTGDPSVSAIGTTLQSILEDMAAPVTVNIDPEGDLFLDATADPSNRKRFRVCSHVLRLHSPVWKRMLFGPWKESKPANENEWVVELPDDPVSPLEIILSIIHCKFDAVPTKPYRAMIHQLLVMANKYDTTSIVRPWSSQWLHLAESRNLVPALVIKSLYIAWELGDEHLFAWRLEQIALNTEIDSEGRLVYAGTIVLEDVDHLGPQTALDTISQIRMGLVQQLISPVHQVLDSRMMQEPFCTKKALYDSSAASTCDAAVVGHIHREMIQTRGGILSRSASEINDSVVNLATWIFSFMAKTDGIHKTTMKDMPECSPKIYFGRINCRIHVSIPAVVGRCMKPGYKEYMTKQRTKTGLVLAEKQTRRAGFRYWKHS